MVATNVLKLDIDSGLIAEAHYVASPNFDDRAHHTTPEVVIIHSISLPPGEYGGSAVEEFFCNTLDCQQHPYFEQLRDVHVSAHFFIRRSGELIQFVPVHKRAWHAGESVCRAKPMVNDFSLGIEMEGLDEGDDGYTSQQYRCLNSLLDALQESFPHLHREHCFAHSDIAPLRKKDPGPHFDWRQIQGG